jgi:hypothetical protein
MYRILIVVLAIALLLIFAHKAFADWRGTDVGGGTTRWSNNEGETFRCTDVGGGVTRCN